MPEQEFRQYLLKDQESNRTRRYHKDRRMGDPLDLKGKPRFQWSETLAEVKRQYKDRVLSNDYCQLIVAGFENGSIHMRYREANQLIDKNFTFDFRYYRPFTTLEGNQRKSGIYTFKT
jgi:hypothetical protein